MDTKTILSSIGVAIAVSSVVVSIAHYIPFRPELDRLKDDIVNTYSRLRAADSENEIRRREEVICNIDSSDKNTYRLCMEHYERERDLRLQTR